MRKSYKSWTIYSIGIFIAWTIIFFVRWRLKGTPSIHDLALVFCGFVIGWLSATIKFVLVSKKIYGLLSLRSKSN
jgi:hypothetical protein